MLDLAIINRMNRGEFAALFGPVFENSPWVAERAWEKRPFDTVTALHTAMLGEIRAMDRKAKVDFLHAHPDLAGREAKEGTMTAESVEEQGTAGLDRLSPDEVATIDGFNRAYRERHGFPFVVCVRHYTKLGIFAEFEARLARDSEAELAEALRQIGHISRYRLEALLRKPRQQVAEPA